MTMLLAENSIPLAFADKLLPDIFTENEIANLYKMGRMKSTCIINKVFATRLLQETISAMKANVFSLATDGSNDTGLEKMNPLTVRIYDVNTSKVVTQFIDMCCTTRPSGTAESIFNKIDKVLQKFEIPWCNCVGFSLVNTRTNMGIRNLIKSRVLRKNNKLLYWVPLSCHP